MPLRAHREAGKAVAFALEQVAAVGDGEAVELARGLRRGKRMPEEAPREVAERRIAVARAVRRPDTENRAEGVGRLHFADKRIAPEMALQSLRPLLLGEDEHMVFALVGLVERAGGGVVRVGGKERKACAAVFAVGAGGDRRAVGGKAPGRAVLGAVADVLRRVAPTVAAVADAGHHGKVCVVHEHGGHAHVRRRRGGFARPFPHAVLDWLKGVGRPRRGGNADDGLAGKADSRVGVVLQKFKHRKALPKKHFSFIVTPRAAHRNASHMRSSFSGTAAPERRNCAAADRHTVCPLPEFRVPRRVSAALCSGRACGGRRTRRARPRERRYAARSARRPHSAA